MQWRKWREALPDIPFAVEAIVAEGNTVVTRWHLTRTHEGEYLGQSATGNKVAADGVSFDQVENEFELMFESDEVIDAKWIGNYEKI